MRGHVNDELARTESRKVPKVKAHSSELQNRRVTSGRMCCFAIDAWIVSTARENLFDLWKGGLSSRSGATTPESCRSGQ